MKDEKKSPKLRFKGFTDDWEQCKLGDVAEITAGGDINKGDLINKGKYPVIANGLNNNGIVGYSNKYKIDAPAVTITGRGTLGVATARFINFTPIVRLISVKSDLDPIYLENAINNTHFVIESTGVPQLTAPQVKRQKVILSNCHIEQTKIGSLLSTLDHTITLHEEKKRQLERLKSALLQKMFADKSGYPAVRFEGFDKAWEERKLKDVVEKQIKGKAQLEKLAPGEVEYLDTSRLNGGQAILTNGLKDVTLDDILILWDGSKAGTVYHGFEGALGSTLKAYRTSANSKFVYQYLKRHQDNIYNNYRTPNIPHVQKDFLNVFTISVPVSDEQEKIGSFFKQLDDTIALHQRKLDLLKEQKKGFYKRCSFRVYNYKIAPKKYFY